jgi:hypothetical protein
MTDIKYAEIYAEISDKVEALANVLHERGYVYSSGYMTSLVKSLVLSYVPQANRRLVLDAIQGHIDSIVNRKQEGA